jgi:hypothetical protein
MREYLLLLVLAFIVTIIRGEITELHVSRESNLATPWDQCGGLSYTGPTICPNDYTCVINSIWYSQCRPDSIKKAYSSLSYKIFITVDDVTSQSFSNASEASLLISIMNSQESIGYYVDAVEITKNQLQSFTTSGQENFRLRGSYPTVLSTNAFNLAISISLYLDGTKSQPSIVYTNSSSTITKAFNDGTLQQEFQKYVGKFTASESTQAKISTLSFSNYQYDKNNSGNSASDISINLRLIIPIVIGAVIFVLLIYCILYHHLEGDKISKDIHRKHILLFSERYMAERFHQDYNVSQVEDPSIMNFISNSLVERHGVDPPKNKNPNVRNKK